MNSLLVRDRARVPTWVGKDEESWGSLGEVGEPELPERGELTCEALIGGTRCAVYSVTHIGMRTVALGRPTLETVMYWTMKGGMRCPLLIRSVAVRPRAGHTGMTLQSGFR